MRHPDRRRRLRGRRRTLTDIDSHARTLCEVLADNFVGLDVLGSLAIGDFDLTSDVDFMVVTTTS
jgi:predicted nucleotidyltransferase